MRMSELISRDRKREYEILGTETTTLNYKCLLSISINPLIFISLRCPGLLVAQKDSTDADGMSRFRSTGSSKSIQSSDIAYNQTEHGRTRHSEGSNGHDVEDDNDRTFVVDTEMLDQLELANNTIVQLQEELEFLRSNPTIDSVNSSEFERIKVERDAAVEQLEIEMGANAESEASWRRLIDELKQENIALEEKLSQELNKTSHLSESEEVISIRQQLEQAKSLFEEANSLSETLRCQVETMQQESKDLTEKVAVLEEDSSTLRSQVATFEEDKITLLASIDSLNKELETVQTNQASTSATEEELEAKVANQHEMLVFAKSTIEDLTAQVTELEAEVATKSTLITDLESRITEKDNQIATDAETIRSLEEKVEGNEAGIAEMERNMQDFFTIVNDSKAREEMIELKLNEEEEKTLELADQVLRLEKQFEGAINDLTAEKMISTQLKGDVNNATIVVQNYEKELSTVSEQLLLSTEKVTGLESKVTDLSQQLASVKDAASHTDNSELAKKDKQLQQMNSEIGGKDGEISRLMKTLQDVQTRCEVAEQELDKSRVRENQVCGDEESMKKRVGQLQTTVDLLKSEKDSLVRKLAESEAALETLYNESCNEKEKMTAHAEAQAKQLAKLQVDLSNASQSISAASALEIKLAAARAEKAVVDEDLKRLSQMAHDLQMSVNDSANASALRDDNDRLRSTATEVGDALTEANQRFKKAKDEAVMLKNELDRVEAEAKSINANLSAAKAERNEFMAELEKALMQVQELTEALVEAENLKSESTADSVQIKELEEKMLKLVADVEAKERVIESFKEEIQELKDATMILPSLDSDELDTIKQEKQDVEQKCETVLAECAELKSVVKKYANMLQRGQEALQDSFDDNELLKTRVSELEEKLEEINKKFKVAAEKETLLVEQYDLLSNELKVKEQALQRVQSEASKSKYVSDQVLASTDKVEAAQDHIEQLREERDSMSAEYTQMRNELRSIKQQYELAESALESARRELIEVVDTKDKRIAHLDKHKLTKEHLEMINKLKDERKKYQEDCKTMKRQLSDLKRAYETLRDSAVTPSENNKAATSRSSKAKADGSEDEQSKDVASLESELIIAKGELDASHTLVLSLRNKLRDCSKQLQEYESERTGIIDVLERNGIDTAGLIYDSKSTSDNEADIGSASLLEADLVDAVSKLAEKLIAAKATIAQIEQKRATTLLSNNERLKELEDSLLHVQAELTETRAQRNVLEKRVETHKSAVRASREEVASLTIDIESVRQAMIVAQEELTEAKSKITNMRMSAPTATDAMAPEIQALEEENIELLKENKDLRKSVATLKAQAEKTAKISEFSQPRQFGTDLGKRILSVDNIMKPTVNETSVTKAADTSDVQQKRIRNRKMSVAGGDENAPGECAQS